MSDVQTNIKMPCHSCSFAKLLSDADPAYECRALDADQDVMALLNEFVGTGQTQKPFVVQSSLTITHDAWPLRFRATAIKHCAGHSSQSARLAA